MTHEYTNFRPSRKVPLLLLNRRAAEDLAHFHRAKFDVRVDEVLVIEVDVISP